MINCEGSWQGDRRVCMCCTGCYEILALRVSAQPHRQQQQRSRRGVLRREVQRRAGWLQVAACWSCQGGNQLLSDASSCAGGAASLPPILQQVLCCRSGNSFFAAAHAAAGAAAATAVAAAASVWLQPSTLQQLGAVGQCRWQTEQRSWSQELCTPASIVCAAMGLVRAAGRSTVVQLCKQWIDSGSC